MVEVGGDISAVMVLNCLTWSECMRTNRRKSLLVAGGVVAMIIIAATATFLLFDINQFKSNIESAALDATGLVVRIHGKMGLSFSPFGISAKDVHVANKGGEIVSLENLKLGLKLMPLLKKHLDVTSCEIVKPVLSIVKDTEGRYNFVSPEKKSTKWLLKASARLHELKLSKGALVYSDKKTGKKTDVKDFNLEIKDLLIAHTPGDIIKLASFSGHFDCKELLQKDFEIDNLTFSVQASKGIYNFQPLTIGSLVYVDRKTGEKTEMKEINLTLRDLSLTDPSAGLLKSVSFTGKMDCKEVRKKSLRVDNLRSSIKLEKAKISLEALSMEIFGGRGEGDATVDLSKVGAVYTIKVKITKLDFEKLEKSFGAKTVIGGKGDLYASLTMKEKGGRKLLSSMNGTLSLRGNNLVMYTIDLDKVLSKYETSQEFNLVDLGAFFLAGPLGPVALRGFRYGDLYSQTRGGQGVITQFISHWKINGGVADATDCALATHHNRVALKGKLNLVSEHYDNVTVAILDNKGCARFKQSVSGPFDRPQISAVSTIESVAGPVVTLYRKAKRFIQGGKCKVFYNGAVRQPPN
jgi:hypothetical protein